MVAFDVDGVRLPDSVAAMGEDALAITVDMGDIDAVRSAFAAVVAATGGVDILVNNAGIGAAAGLLTLDEDGWDRVMNVNLKGAFVLSQLVANDMIRRSCRGRIVNVSSAQAFRAVGARGVYSVSKAGLAGLTRALAAEVGVHGINVNAVAPGATDTQMVRRALGPDAAKLLAAGGQLQSLLGTVNTAEDVANVIVFLCLPASRQMTAQTLHISGGAIA